MNTSERLSATLNFEKPEDRGAFAETFFPWTLTVERWLKEGIPEKFTADYLYPQAKDRSRRYFNDLMTDPVIVKIVVSKILIFYWLHIHLGCRTLLRAESSCQ